MANTYSQINIHGVFSVKGRANLLQAPIRPKVFEYISGIMKGVGLYPLAVNGFTDHVHVFFELPPAISVSKALQDIKTNSSAWINKNSLVTKRFEWQVGYGAFSYSRSQRNDVIQYIKNQEQHHQKTSFREEYLAFLKSFEIEFDDKYLFEFYD